MTFAGRLRSGTAYIGAADADCWEWRGTRDRRGYGRLRRGPANAGTVAARRAAWELTHGPILDGLDVCHSCDNPPCVNVTHLFLGTRSDNMVDMVSKGRDNPRRGEKSPLSKLTDVQRTEVRSLVASGHSRRAIARGMGVSADTINRVVLGYHARRKHVREV